MTLKQQLERSLESAEFLPPVAADCPDQYVFTSEGLGGFPSWNNPPKPLQSELEPDDR
jgi:hypothetical protein